MGAQAGGRCKRTSRRARLAGARALDHRLGGPAGSAATPPRATRSPAGDAAAFAIPGFNPVEAYEAAIAHLAPGLERRPQPEWAAELLAWAGEPLATAEVAAIPQLEPGGPGGARPRRPPSAAGAEFYWFLE